MTTLQQEHEAVSKFLTGGLANSADNLAELIAVHDAVEDPNEGATVVDLIKGEDGVFRQPTDEEWDKFAEREMQDAEHAGTYDAEEMS